MDSSASQPSTQPMNAKRTANGGSTDSEFSVFYCMKRVLSIMYIEKIVVVKRPDPNGIIEDGKS